MGDKSPSILSAIGKFCFAQNRNYSELRPSIFGVNYKVTRQNGGEP